MTVRSLLVGAVAGIVLLAAGCGDDKPDSTAATTVPVAPTTSTGASTGASTSSSTKGTAAATSVGGSTSPGSQPAAVPQRIVSLSPTATETLFAIGAGKQVIAVDDQSNYPAEAAAVKTDLSSYQPNVEAVAGYKPDLVVISGDDKLQSQLESVGLKVWSGPAASTFDEAYTQIEQLGAATGHVADAAKVVADMQGDLAKLAADVPPETKGLSVYHELDQTGYAAASGTFIGQVYKMFGLTNVADAANDPSGYPQLNTEAVIAANPDLIFLADTKCCQQSLEAVKARPGWDAITAVKDGHVFAMDDDIASRWGPRVVDYAQQVHDALQQVAVPAG